MARKMSWVFAPAKIKTVKVPDYVKTSLVEQANHLIESDLKPRQVKLKATASDFNYIVDIFVKWHRSYFYFCAKYRCPAPDRITEFFETKFARMEYVGDDSFNLSYMRHTEQWWEIYHGLSLQRCLEAIRKEPHFLP